MIAAHLAVLLAVSLSWQSTALAVALGVAVSHALAPVQVVRLHPDKAVPLVARVARAGGPGIFVELVG